MSGSEREGGGGDRDKLKTKLNVMKSYLLRKRMHISSEMCVSILS